MINILVILNKDSWPKWLKTKVNRYEAWGKPRYSARRMESYHEWQVPGGRADQALEQILLVIVCQFLNLALYSLFQSLIRIFALIHGKYWISVFFFVLLLWSLDTRVTLASQNKLQCLPSFSMLQNNLKRYTLVFKDILKTPMKLPGPSAFCGTFP